MKSYPSLEGVQKAALCLSNVSKRTPLELNKRLSDTTGASVFIKREDLQQVRSFKIRGAYNKISSLSSEEYSKGIICASAGNIRGHPSPHRCHRRQDHRFTGPI